MAKSQLPMIQTSASPPPLSLPPPVWAQDQTSDQSLFDGTGHGTETTGSASEAWWRTFTLNSREAAAGSPLGYAACGEEDPGSGLEFLVTQKRRRTEPS